MGRYKHIAVVLAGGKGSRMNSDTPKQYIELKGNPVLYYSLKTFEDSFMDAVVLVCGKNEEQYCQKNIIEKYALKKVCAIVSGGKERYDSVFNGLKEIERLGIAADDAFVYIHDGARPCIDAELLMECRRSVEQYGACIPAVPVKDTIKITDEDGFCAGTPKRSTLMAVQTPQCFSFVNILEAYCAMEKALAEKSALADVTDDAMAAERFGKMKVKLCKGSYNNIKITTPEDIRIASQIL